MKESEARDGRARSRIALLLLSVLILAALLAPIALAITNPFSGFGSRMSSILGSYASSNTPTFFDFLLFFVIFFALCWVGFSNVFKEAKGPNIALSIALGLALSVALVYGGKFTIKKLLPFAAAVLFLLLIILLYSLLKKYIFSKDTIISKVLSWIFAILLSLLLLFVAWSFICSGNSCESNPFMKKVFGSESIVGKFFGGISSAVGVQGIPSPAPTRTVSKQDTGAPITGPAPTPEKTVLQKVADVGWGNYAWLALIIALLVAALVISVIKRKEISAGIKNGLGRWKKRKEVGAFNSLLKDLASHEKSNAQHMKDLIEKVKEERTPFDVSRHIMENVTQDIKQTIGGNIDLIKQGEKAGLTANVDRLKVINATEKAIVSQILPAIDAELREITSIPKKVSDQLNALEGVEDHFDEHDRILESFKHYDFSERGTIRKMQEDLSQNRKRFEDFSNVCNNMIQVIDRELAAISNVDEGKLPYEQIVGHMKGIRNNAILLNNLFSTKVNLLHIIMQKMEELRADVHALHNEEVKKLKGFYDQAVAARDYQHFDTAIYLASHIVENARFILHNELDPATKEEVQRLWTESVDLIKKCVPHAFESMKERIEAWLIEGKYDNVRKLVQHMVIDYFKRDLAPDIRKEIADHNSKMSRVAGLTDDMQKGEIVFRELCTIMGVSPDSIPAAARPAAQRP
jgi:heme exporter protein D